MKTLKHISASASYYDERAPHYDELNEKIASFIIINNSIEKVLRKYDAISVLDMTCGTGSQVFWLLEAGFEVIGCDISKSMLKVAQKKAEDKNIDAQFIEGDTRTTRVGEFDAVITIFNAIGHLTRDDFAKALRNIWDNLRDGGIYIFDNFNLDYLRHEDNITKLTLDELAVSSDGSSVREVQFSYVTHDGILCSHSTYIEQEKAGGEVQISGYDNTLQCYTINELKSMLEEAGFEILEQIDIEGQQFLQNESERVLVVARKNSTILIVY